MVVKKIIGSITNRSMSLVKSQQNRKIMQKLADDMGLVYFGYVNQNSDEHRVIRGYTVSPTHRDNHYSIGTFRSRDIVLVQRDDILKFANKKRPKAAHWNIAVIDLKIEHDLPHIYIGHRMLLDSYNAKHQPLVPVNLGAYSYGQLFNATYQVYAKPSVAPEFLHLLPPNFAEVLAGHFWDMSIEFVGKSVYIYSQNQHPSRKLLESMLGNGLWLAELIEARLNGQ